MLSSDGLFERALIVEDLDEPREWLADLLPRALPSVRQVDAVATLALARERMQEHAYGLALVINGKSYIIGGEGRSDVWEYDPGANSWTEKASFGSARGFAAGFVVGNTGYFGTGSGTGSGGTDDFWGFDPSAPVNDDDDL